MNTGAGMATGSILLFLHADNTLPDKWDEHICHALGCDGDSRVNHDKKKVNGKRISSSSWGCFKTIQTDV